MTPLESLLSRLPELDDAELIELEEELRRRERAISIPAGLVVWTCIDGHVAPWSIVDVLAEDDGPRVEVLTSTGAVTFVLTLDEARAGRYPRGGVDHLLLSIGAARSYLLAPYWADDFSEN